MSIKKRYPLRKGKFSLRQGDETGVEHLLQREQHAELGVVPRQAALIVDGVGLAHGAAGLRPSVSSNPALSGFHSVQEKSEARWMYERLLAFYIRLPENKNKKFLLELCRTGIKDAMPHIPDSVVSVSAF